jgi:Protein of unknown function (DUF3175)
VGAKRQVSLDFSAERPLYQGCGIDRSGHGIQEVRPKGIASGIRMIQYFINRGGKGLSAARKRELEKAKHLLQQKATAAKTKSRANSPG